jgi:hypothetical protein
VFLHIFREGKTVRAKQTIQIIEGFKLGSLGAGHSIKQRQTPKSILDKYEIPEKPIVRIGTKLQVVEGSGLDSGKIGVVISPRDLLYTQRGVPEIDGYYKPVDWEEEVPLQLEDNSIIIMTKHRLREVK